jgi:glycosyltransferase involved in cell wall biosynthesis
MDTKRTFKELSVAIISHNYGQFLPEILQCILDQSITPGEILVVDDHSSDGTEGIVREFADQGVTYLRVDFQNVLLARKSAIEHTSGRIICCLDADDILDPLYLEGGLEAFKKDPRIGIVYSDIIMFGDTNKEIQFPSSSQDKDADISLSNFIHAGSLARRDAIEVADAFNHTGNPDRHEDWMTWKKILDMGFIAVKQPYKYFYRKHSLSLSSRRIFGENGYTYFKGASLSETEITLFTPLSGRKQYWDKYRLFLEEQSRDHRKIHLILMDTSKDPEFSRMVRDWLSHCDYLSTQYLEYPVGRSGLADECRIDEDLEYKEDLIKEFRHTMCRIYNRIRTLVSTDYLWILHDDIIPPLDAGERMLQSFCLDVASVTAAYANRFKESFDFWDHNGNYLKKSNEGVHFIGGNGFACVILRAHFFKNWVFSSSEEYPDFSKGFYAHLPEGLIPKIDWDIRCEHLSPSYLEVESFYKPPEKPYPEEEFDEVYYLKKHADVALAIKEGKISDAYSHYEKNGWKERRIARVKVKTNKAENNVSAPVESKNIKENETVVSEIPGEKIQIDLSFNPEGGIPDRPNPLDLLLKSN